MRKATKTDINPVWRIKTLTEQFGVCGIGWYYKSVKKWMETYGEETAAFVDIELFIKIDGEWSMPIMGTGGSMFVAKEKSGPYVSDECYKMATTDAISVACKQLGIGANVYWESDKSKYDKSKDNRSEDKACAGSKENTYQLDVNILASIYDLVEEYTQIQNDISREQILNILQNKFKYKDLKILKKENAFTVIKQLETWIEKQKEKNESVE